MRKFSASKNLVRTSFNLLSRSLSGRNESQVRDMKQFEMVVHPTGDGKLCITRHDFTSKTTRALIDFLAKNTAIRKIDFTNNLFVAGAHELMVALKGNKFLQELVLIDNWFNFDHTEQKTEALLDLLQNPSLKEVHIDIDLGTSGIFETAQALKNNKSLQALSLKTTIRPGTIDDAITKMIPQNTVLRALSYGDNSVAGERFVDSMETSLFQGKIQEALRENALLENVYITHGTDYRHIVNNNATQIRDAIKDYSAILGTRIIRKITEITPEHKFNRSELRKISSYAAEKTEEILLKNLTNAEMIAFSNHWHSPFHQTTSRKLRDYNDQDWPPLFGQKELNIPESVVGLKGWKFIARTNAKELELEGNNLRHCVGGYTSRCMLGNSHIVSVVDASGNSISTIEFNASGQCIQHQGKNNQPPSEPAGRAVDWVQKEIKNENIKIDRTRINSANELLTTFGFNPHDDEKFKEIVSVYKKQMLPSGKYEIPQLSENFLNDFLGKIELKIDGHELILESILEKDRTEEEARLHKIKAGIQGSTNKICGKDVAKTSVVKDKVFFSTKNPDALKKLQKLFDGKYEEKEDGLLITGGLDPQGVRQILTRTAKAERSVKMQEAAKHHRQQILSTDDVTFDLEEKNPGSIIHNSAPPSSLAHNSRDLPRQG